MLTLTIKGREFFDASTNKFHTFPDTEMHMEHSLKSIAAWESKWKKPFLIDKQKSTEEIVDYIRLMCVEDPGPYIGLCLDQEAVNKIESYISDSMTASWFSDTKKGKSSSEVVTAEIVYYWMITLNIPMECDKWHLNRLLTLIRVTSLKNQPPKKMSKREQMTRQHALNAARLNATGSRG